MEIVNKIEQGKDSRKKEMGMVCTIVDAVVGRGASCCGFYGVRKL